VGTRVAKWKRLETKERYDAAILDIRRVVFESESGRRGLFTTIGARDWAIVVPVAELEDGPSCVMVRQYRHGADALFLEFPGGVVERGEDPAAGVLRELEEETGWRAGRLFSAGTVSPNPAFLENSFHVFVALDLERTGTVSLDEHEEIEVVLVPLDEVRAGMGAGECANAMMVTGLFLAERVLARELTGESGRNPGLRTGP
jgi:8-oxo-dGTP pyrophosphatase MutT (NUDIX family)